MIEKEVFPSSFQETTLHMVFKGGNGRRQNLPDNRFVHSKFWFPRMVEGLVVVQGLKEPLVEGSTMYQIGGQPGHRAEELIFSLKSIVAKYRSEGKPIIIQSSDISKFFDKEMMEDAILTCLKRGADQKAVRCWYKLNEKTRIRVKTGAGLSEFCEAGALVGQGTLGGALISQGVLDEGMRDEFLPGDRDEMNYGDVPLALGPMIFQDDVIHLAGGISEARLANGKIDRVVKRLNLRLNQDKTVYLIMGSKKQLLDMSTELDSDPLYCGDFQTDKKTTLKWLGQTLSSGGLSESVAATVEAREGKIRGACLEISQIVNDWRAKAAGGKQLYFCGKPVASLVYLMEQEHGQKLNQTQNWFLRLVFQIGKGAPLVSLLWDSGF